MEFLRFILVALFLFVITLVSAGANYERHVSATLSEKPRVGIAYRWLSCQQDKSTGLLHSYDIPGDETAWTYDQGLAIIAFLAVGDVFAARDCADAMLDIRDKNYQVWADSYNVCSGKTVAKPLAVGPSAWMGLALLRLYKVTKEPKYLTASDKIGKFILSLQSQMDSTIGSVSGGYDENRELFTWTSTEHNVDSVAFLAALSEFTNNKSYREAAIKIIKWLDRAMWDKENKCYFPGYEDNKKALLSHYPERLDSQTWCILALKAAAEHVGWPRDIADLLHNGLPWIDQYQCEVTYENNKLSGFSKITGNQILFLEQSSHAGYVALAARDSTVHHDPMNWNHPSSIWRDGVRA